MGDDMNVAWSDLQVNFSLTSISKFVTFVSSARVAHYFDGGANLPDNMLGDPRDASGNIVTATDPTTGALVGVVFKGRPGQAAFSYTDLGGNVVNVAAVGDPTRMYIDVRAPVSSAALTAVLAQAGKTLASYDVVVSDPVVSAQILGTWA
jgi:hypothetical protein